MINLIDRTPGQRFSKINTTKGTKYSIEINENENPSTGIKSKIMIIRKT